MESIGKKRIATRMSPTWKSDKQGWESRNFKEQRKKRRTEENIRKSSPFAQKKLENFFFMKVNTEEWKSFPVYLFLVGLFVFWYDTVMQLSWRGELLQYQNDGRFSMSRTSSPHTSCWLADPCWRKWCEQMQHRLAKKISTSRYS